MPQRKKYAQERRSIILEELLLNQSVSVSWICKQLGVSAVTARADLDALAASGRLRRTHGGALSLRRAPNVSVQDLRVAVNSEEKRSIAKAAVDLVEDGMSIFVDSGTTSLELVRFLSEKEGLSIITSDLTIADLIDQEMPASEVVVLGGALRKSHRYTYGPLALAAVKSLFVDIAFICPFSFVTHIGFMSSHPAMAEFKSAMLGAAAERVMLFDHTKIQKPSLMKFASIDDCEVIICDKDVDGQLQQVLKEAPQIKLILSDEARDIEAADI